MLSLRSHWWKGNYSSQSMLQWSVDVSKYESYYPFYMFLNSSLKLTTSFHNIAKTTARKDMLGKISDHQELGLYKKNNF